jgi:hypothetical protein
MIRIRLEAFLKVFIVQHHVGVFGFVAILRSSHFEAPYLLAIRPRIEQSDMAMKQMNPAATIRPLDRSFLLRTSRSAVLAASSERAASTRGRSQYSLRHLSIALRPPFLGQRATMPSTAVAIANAPTAAIQHKGSELEDSAAAMPDAPTKIAAREFRFAALDE